MAGNRSSIFRSCGSSTRAEWRRSTACFAPASTAGYISRLFPSKPFPTRGQNWTTHNILGVLWHAMSWNGVDASLGWDEILGARLGPL